MSVIIAYIMTTPDGTKLQSYYRHDYKTYLDKNGKFYMIDGGIDYCHRSVNGDERIEIVTTDDLHNIIRQAMHWGTRGIDGKQPLQYKPIAALDTDHIKAILDTQYHILDWLRKIFVEELRWRASNVG